MTCRLGPNPRLLHAGANPVHVVAHPRPDEGVHGGGGEPLELPELGRHGHRRGHEAVGMRFAHDGRGPLLVGGIDPGEEKAHRDRLHAFVPESAGGASHRLLVERDEDLAGRRRDPLRHREAVPAAHEGSVLPRDLLPNGVVLGSLVAADVDDVAVALAGDHPGAGAVMGEDRVGRDGGAVKQVSDLVGGDRLPLAELAYRAEHAARRIVGGGRHLVDPDVVRLGVGEHHVGERPADVDSDELHEASRVCVFEASIGEGPGLAKACRANHKAANPRRIDGCGRPYRSAGPRSHLATLPAAPATCYLVTARIRSHAGRSRR